MRAASRWRAAGVGVLGVAAVATASVALRGPSLPLTAPAPATAGALAASGRLLWRWAGPSDCNAAADAVPLQRLVGGRWRASDVPLVNVDRISIAANGSGIAVGTTTSCGRGVAVTSDSGATWTTPSPMPALLDGVLAGDRTVYGIVRAPDGSTLLRRYVLDGSRLRAGPGVQETACDATDGVPTQVAAFSSRSVLLLCQQQTVQQRLLARSTTAGRNWDRLTDNRPLTGLNGSGTFTRMAVAGSVDVWLLLRDGPCAAGQVRRSTSAGQFFDALPCLGRADGVVRVLDVAPIGQTLGAALVVGTDGRVRVLTTRNSGQTWQK